MSNENIYQELRNAVEDLEKNISKFDSEACERTALKVLKDKGVQDAFVKEINSHENVFQSLRCKR